MKKKNKKLISGLILLCTVILIQTGCVTQKKCEQKFPTKDSVSVVVVYNDSLVFIGDTLYFPGDSTIIHDTIPCPDFHKESTTRRIKASVTIKNGKLTVKCNEDSLMKELAYWKKIKIPSKSTFKSEKSDPIIEYKTTKFDIFCRWGFVISLLIIVILLTGKVVKEGLIKVFQK